MTTFFFDGPLAAASPVTLPESAAHHARVKRMSVGDPVQITNGAGTIAHGTIRRLARAAVDVDVSAAGPVAAPVPLELYAPVGDRDRMLWLAEKATELGATAWRPVQFHRSRSVSPRGEGEAFAAKVRARMINALEQSGGAWLPVLHPETDVVSVARDGTMPARYLLDAAGSRFEMADAVQGTAVILGPEGGMEAAERDALIAGGWRPVALAATILRFETAAVAALAIVRAAQVSSPGSSSEVVHG